MRLAGVELGPGGRREEQGGMYACVCACGGSEFAHGLGHAGTGSHAPAAQAGRIPCRAGRAHGQSTVGGAARTHAPPAELAPATATVGAPSARGMARSASTFTCASVGAASAPAPAVAAPGTAPATRQATAGGVARGQGMRGIGRRWRRGEGGWYSNARAGENIGENSDEGGASATKYLSGWCDGMAKLASLDEDGGGGKQKVSCLSPWVTPPKAQTNPRNGRLKGA
ncbi:hypothetical protein DFH08DRAFT_808804 [Mycena albidolilacea]|uniref:Uncharacterized protein n=1 Tax=Mycena albidolilacea TaxID=1033008 RepID=A0AAD7A2H2_9AGAR|nr:hypothetical protein DFH08DRAFT_808804 [Mycena albidolilacea]